MAAPNKQAPSAAQAASELDIDEAIAEGAAPEREIDVALGDDIMVIENLSVKFGGLVALDDVSFTIKRGEILGLIGYTFLAVSLLYIPTRRWLWTPLAWLIALLTFNALCTAKWIVLPRHLPLYFWPFDNGAMAAIMMGGIVTSVIFLGDHRWKALGQKMSMAVAFALASLAAGRLLTRGSL